MRVSQMARRFVIGTAFALCLGLAHNAQAGWVFYKEQQGDGEDYHLIQHYFDEDDPNWILTVFYIDDDVFWYKHKIGSGNPNPDGTGSGLKPGKSDARARLELALQKGGEWMPRVEFWQTEIGKGLTAKGKGPSVIDPSDDDRGGPTGTGVGRKKVQEQQFQNHLALEPGALGSSKGGFDLDAGTPKQQAQGKKHSPGKKNGDGSDKDPPPDFVDPAMQGIGPPELVNPSPEPVTKSRAKKVVANGLPRKLALNAPPKKLGTLALGGPGTKPALGGPDTRRALGGPDTKPGRLGPGLLDGGPGLGSQGPLSAGAPRAALRMR